MATERVVGVGDVDLAILEAGEGGRPLLLVHGFTGAKEDFGDFVDPLAEEGFWVVAPDLRGHGASAQPADEAAYSLATFADDVESLASTLGWDRFALLGHSMGGMIAQELVLRPDAPVDRLVLMDTHHGPVDALDDETVAFGLEILRTQGLPALVELIAQLPARPKAPSDVRVRTERAGYAEWADAKVHRCSAAMYAAMGVELTTRHDRLDDLARLDLPVRVVVGDEDRDFLAASHRIAAAVPGADLVVIADAAHCPQFESPTAWWGAVVPFLADGAAGTAR